MSIGIEHFGLNQRTGELDASIGLQRAPFPYRVQCRSCGFEPLDVGIAPIRCPKCIASDWERYTIPGSLLIDADFRAGRASGWRHFDTAPRSLHHGMCCAADPRPKSA